MKNIYFTELTLENIADWSVAVKYALSAVLAGCLIALGYWLLVKPNVERHAALVRQEKTLRAEFEQKQQQAAHLEGYLNQITILRDRFSKMLAQLPAEHEMPGLLEDISKTGIASGLDFERFALQPEISHEFYIEMPIIISVVGTYHQLAVFLSRLAQMSRIVTLHDFDITRVPAQQEAVKKEQEEDALRMKITAKIYRYKSL
ncbi:MAG: type 4a pilus biogenesis protein PilO [Legionellaceae bacterium]|nr:type 4a pilus biogenesis protein PilO [Legionellaceae bacterium]